MHPFNRIVLQAVFVAAAAYAMFKELQIVAVAALVGVLFIFCWMQVRIVRDALLPLAARTTKAKLQNFEVEISGKNVFLEALLSDQPPWLRSILNGLEPNHIGLLTLLKDKDKYVFPSALRDSFGVLRNAGLVEHESALLTDSKTIWLSPLGTDVVKRLQANISHIHNAENDS
jgi:hypothetical protein